MNKTQTLQLFRQGRNAWNKWAANLLANQKEYPNWDELSTVDFTNHYFDTDRSLKGYIFPGTTLFDSAKFGSVAVFSDAVFHGHVSFGNADFSFGSVFTKATFSGVVTFKEASFGKSSTFDKTVFSTAVDFSQATFTDRSSFAQSKFLGVAVFARCKFNLDANFRNAVIHSLEMDHAIFAREVWFEHALFREGASFQHTDFLSDAIFKHALVEQQAQFCYSNFKGNAYFEGAIFSDLVVFDDVKFDRGADFTKSRFDGNADFKVVSFSENATFDRAVFRASVDFNLSEFGGKASFMSTEFLGTTTFEGTCFKRDTLFAAQFVEITSFLSAKFEGSVWFSNSVFSNIGIFDLAKFCRYATFRACRFMRPPTFIAVDVESGFSLEDVSFVGVPDFEQASFKEAPRLDVAAFSPLVVSTKQNVNVAARWRALNRLAVQAHDYERQLLFLAEEIKARRGVQDRIWNARYWGGIVYEGWSDFGRSILRPILWLIDSTLIFAMFYLWRHVEDPSLAPCDTSRSDAVAEALYIGVHKMAVFSGLGGSTKLNQAYACLYGGTERYPMIPDPVAYAGLLQTAVSAALLFLFVLAVRNHFRLK